MCRAAQKITEIFLSLKESERTSLLSQFYPNVSKTIRPDNAPGVGTPRDVPFPLHIWVRPEVFVITSGSTQTGESGSF
jgi:hypothetical protein